MPTLTQLIKAKETLERELESVKHKIAEELGLNSAAPSRRRRRSRRGQHKLSAAARRKISRAQKARWAKVKKEEKAAT